MKLLKSVARLIVVLMVCSVVVPTPAEAQTSSTRSAVSRAFDVAFGAVSVWRDGNAGGAPGGGVVLGMGRGRAQLALEATGTRRRGHNDWRGLSGLRLWLGDSPGGGLYVTGLAGVLARSSKTGFALVAGIGGQWRSTNRVGLRLQGDATRDSVGGIMRNGVRASVWIVIR